MVDGYIVLVSSFHKRKQPQYVTISRMTVEELHRQISGMLKAGHIDNSLLESRLLICSALGVDHIGFIKATGNQINQMTHSLAWELARRRINGESIAVLTGKRDFYNRTYRVTEDVLVPRPETELLVERALELLPEEGAVSVLDIGTGSGIIAITIAEQRLDAVLTAIDISEKALRVAEVNARECGVAERIKLVQCDIKMSIPEGVFDLVVSNPPYIPSAELDGLYRDKLVSDPSTALDGGITGLDFYRRIISVSSQLVLPGGYIAFEHGIGQYSDIAELLEEMHFTDVTGYNDLAGIDRVITACYKGNRDD
jgi:release factor glutamine methyltransferase